MKMNETLFIKHSELSERKVLYEYSVAIVIQLHLRCTFSVHFSQPGKGGKVGNAWITSQDMDLFPPLVNFPLSLPLFYFL